MKACWIPPLLLAIAATPAKRLEICPRHPDFFRDGGRHILLVGVSDRDLFFLWENEKGFSWRKYLDAIAAHHLDYVRQDVVSWGGLLAPVRYPGQFSKPAWPFARPGPGEAVDGRPKFDLSRFDPSYFETRLEPFLREAARRGIYVELTLFDDPRGRGFAQSLYADANNVNRLGLRPGQATSDAALARPRLMAIEHAYVDRVLAETSAFGNVIYEIANETGGRRWVAHFIDYIHEHPIHPGRLVSAGEQASPFDPRSGANDIVVKHRGGGGPYATDADLRSHHEALLRFRAGKPVTHNEYFLFVHGGTDDLDFPRKMMWADFTAGGHANLYDFTFWRGRGRTAGDGSPSRPPPPEILEGGRHLLDFLAENAIPFWTMAPHDELAEVEGGGAHVFTFARPGDAYIAYVLGKGPRTVILQLPDGLYAARWYDPEGGRFLGPAQRARGGGRRRFRSPPFEEDIVLYVRGQRRGHPLGPRGRDPVDSRLQAVCPPGEGRKGGGDGGGSPAVCASIHPALTLVLGIVPSPAAAPLGPPYGAAPAGPVPVSPLAAASAAPGAAAPVPSAPGPMDPAEIERRSRAGETLGPEIAARFPPSPQRVAGDRGIDVLIDLAHQALFFTMWRLPPVLRRHGFRACGSQAALDTVLVPGRPVRIRIRVGGRRPFAWWPVPRFHVVFTHQGDPGAQPYAPEEIEALRAFVRAGGGLVAVGGRVGDAGRVAAWPLNGLLGAFGAGFAPDAVRFEGARVNALRLGAGWEATEGRPAGRPVIARRRFGAGRVVAISALALIDWERGRRAERLARLVDALAWAAGDALPAAGPLRLPVEAGGGGPIYPERSRRIGNVLVYYAHNQKPDLLAVIEKEMPSLKARIEGWLPSAPPAEPMHLVLAAGGGGGWAVNAYRPKEVGIISLSRIGILSVFAHELAHTMAGPPNARGGVAGHWPLGNQGEAHAGWFQGKALALLTGARAGHDPNALFRFDPDGTALDLAGSRDAIARRFGRGAAWTKTWWVWQKLDDRYGTTWYPRWRWVQHTRWRGDPDRRLTWEETIEDMSIAVGEDLFPFFARIGTTLRRRRFPRATFQGRTIPLRPAPIPLGPAGPARLEPAADFTAPLRARPDAGRQPPEGGGPGEGGHRGRRDGAPAATAPPCDARRWRVPPGAGSPCALAENTTHRSGSRRDRSAGDPSPPGKPPSGALTRASTEGRIVAVWIARAGATISVPRLQVHGGRPGPHDGSPRPLRPPDARAEAPQQIGEIGRDSLPGGGTILPRTITPRRPS